MDDSTSALKLEVKVIRPVFLGILWAGTSFSLTLVIFRLYVRLRAFKRLLADDYFVILAMALLLATSILWQTQADILYDQYAVAGGTKNIYPEFLERAEQFLHVPFTLLFYSSLWCVKIGFLLFFKRIGYEIKLFKVWWWCVLGVTIATYAACMGDFQFECITGSLVDIMSYCGTRKAVHFENRILIINCVLDVFSDMCIISIPVLMLWNVRIPLRKKAILLGIFSLIIVVVVISIIRVRVILGKDKDKNPDITWMYFWSNLEMATSITIACVASFRQLFVHTQTQREQNTSNFHGSSAKTSKFKSFLASRTETKFSSRSGTHSSSQKIWPAKRLDENAPVFPLEQIHVEYNLDITDSPTKEGGENPNSTYYVFPPPKASSRAI